ncbi:MAG: PDGLE domain-containing protein [Ardenticatenaceae bacterium]|nr:PDGLE domain-containing protein [Ardenticatenaceae bacterium]
MHSLFLAGIQLLHVPDGFLNIPISGLCWVVTLIVLYFAVRQAQQDFDERLVPLAGIMAAFIFAGQMLNFPVAGGTSGHLIGATLAFVVLGPWVGVLAMTAVISLQALIFQDGGLVVMGANILIMGIVPGFMGYGLFQMVKNQSRQVKLGVTAVAAWLSVMTAALVTALLLGFSGTTSLALAVPAMLGVHALIGLGEALITVAALSFIMQTRPQLLTDDAPAGSGKWIVSGIVLALLVVLLAPFASGSPDGLEWVAGQAGFLDTAVNAPFQILPDYTIPGLGETGLSTILAGIVGALVVAAVTFGLGRLLRR